jgi:hypothetical protein
MSLGSVFLARFKGGFQGTLETPNANVVEIQAIAVAGFQSVDEEVVQGDLGQKVIELLGVHGGFPWVIDVLVMNALLKLKAKCFPMA